MTRLINLRPSRRGRIVAGAIPILLLCLAYALVAALRHADNPADKVLPTIGAMGVAIWHMAAQVDPVTGQITLLADTLASLSRLGAGLALATVSALAIGLLLGVMPLARAILGPMITVIGPVQNRSTCGNSRVNGRVPRIENQMTYLRPKRSPSGPPATVPTATAARKANRCIWACSTEV